MIVGCWQRWIRHRGAVVRPHDPLCQEIIPEQGGDQQVLPEQPLENVVRKDQPGDRIRDGGKDPIELSQRRPTVLEVTGDLHDQIDRDLGLGIARVDVHAQRILQDEKPERDLDRRGQAAREQVRREFWGHGQRLIGLTRCQVDAIEERRIGPIDRRVGFIRIGRGRLSRLSPRSGRIGVPPLCPPVEVADNVARRRTVPDEDAWAIGRNKSDLGSNVGLLHFVCRLTFPTSSAGQTS
jgi:hypothetical protein